MNPEKFRKKSRDDKQDQNVNWRAEFNSLNPTDWNNPINFLFVGVPAIARKGGKGCPQR